jgi:hypothetical protein
MPLTSEVARSLSYLRKRYNVSERDLVALAKKLEAQEEPEESWEQIVRNYKTQRQRRLRKYND